MLKVFGFIKKNHISILFGLVVLVAVFLRFYNLPERMWWEGDSAEDITIAYHISNFGESIRTGRSNVGGGELIKNSYFYFYLLAGIHSLGDSALSVGAFFALNSVLLVVFIYFAGKYFVNSRLALVLAVMVTLNSYLNFVSIISIYNIINLMVVGMLWLFLKFWQNRSWKFFMGYILVLFVTLHGNYSVLTIFPIYVFWGIVGYFRATREKGKLIKCLTIIWPLSLLGLWMVVTYRGGGIFDQFKVVNLITRSGLGMGELWNNWEQILTVSAGYLWNMTNTWLIVIFYSIVYLGLGFLVIYDYRQRNLFFQKSIFLLSLIAGIFLTGFMGGGETVDRYYVLFYYPLWLLSMVYVWGRFSKFGWIWKYGVGLMVIVCLIMGMNILDKNRGTGLINRNSSGMKESELLADKIMRDSKVNLIDNYNIVFYNKHTQLDHFGGSIFWYPIEKRLGTQKVKIVEYSGGEYLEEINTSKDSYLVCYDYESSGRWVRFNDCEKLFIEKHADKKYKIIKVEEGAEGDWFYKLYRIKEL
ncbi:MAG: hypothetical protein US68_C0016G0010 [Candidatus Shapirobacteria bacterium GW2011_GWE1_38_10]|uniref:Glycosyltransferase RgtA/B/C/D-like domain-containing protein n=1 Tax=Candidatus Shapirobacteria bacterium GW2011_GWE1_38_10 TaxID=1618488 RepID=A0A0G0IEC8_9BACT|nr:MAG: hypothetical protein US46_C0009G0008 [Candidatus Shapirobacteria bacterium GW2011_GWF2_37_20]KKQ49350.1 MAG: hypothetical protein US68_C0016G0010 [Candidatus Shapirobacteria bacterium GW2011_GWE1_38_10]KKQ65081.1 MAG: hypothetical protein US85_C0001G0008 [Candidatus Shapirobacteria bacterium GW2011_GWF1_38_23]HBP51355.1 hypothetical protein [Candidatus Shapirobacteria bacterium]